MTTSTYRVRFMAIDTHRVITADEYDINYNTITQAYDVVFRFQGDLTEEMFIPRGTLFSIAQE